LLASWATARATFIIDTEFVVSMKAVSVGAIIKRDGHYLLMDRKFPPPGFACVAGHVEAGQTPEEAVIEEVKEEAGVDAISAEKVFEGNMPHDDCGMHKSHYWHVFVVSVTGEPQLFAHEQWSLGWYTTKQIKQMPIEEAWQYFFKKVGIE
jgi:8-oxo-dGTP diphosphatase